MKKARFLAVSAAALLAAACSSGSIAGPEDVAAPRFGVSTMGSGGYTSDPTSPEGTGTVQEGGSLMGSGGYTGDPGVGDPDETERGVSTMGSGI